MKKTVIFLGLVIFTLGFLSLGSSAYAVTDPCDNPDVVSSICAETKDTDGFSNTTQNIINTLLYGAGIVAVIMIVIGGIRYITSSGDPGRTSSARNTIVYSVVGLVIAILAFAIVNFVLARL